MRDSNKNSEGDWRTTLKEKEAKRSMGMFLFVGVAVLILIPRHGYYKPFVCIVLSGCSTNG